MKRWSVAFCLFWWAIIPAVAQSSPTIYTVSYPLAYFAERLAGESAEVVFPVPSDRDPAFWRPPIAVIADYQTADLILLNGAGYASWTANASLPRSALVDTSRTFQSRLIETDSVTHSHGGDGEHTHAAVASHVWLDFQIAAEQANAVAVVLRRFLPEGPVNAELDQLLADLDRLDQLARSIDSGATLLASHPRYQYLARSSGLAIESVEWPASETPNDAQWQTLDDLHEQWPQARIFLWEAEPTAEAQAGIAERGLTGVWFDLADHRPEEGDFITLMEENLTALQRALSEVE